MISFFYILMKLLIKVKIDVKIIRWMVDGKEVELILRGEKD